MRKRILACLVILFMVLAQPTSAHCETVFTIGSTKYYVDQQQKTMDVPAFIKDSRTFLPVRFMANAVGIEDNDIIWNSAASMVTLVKGNLIVQMTIGNSVMLVNGFAVIMDAAPEIKDGRTVLPLRFLAQALNVDITWDPTNQTITVGGTPQSNPTASPSLIPGLIDIPPLRYEDSVKTVSRDLEWRYNGAIYRWHVEVPCDLIDWNREVQQIVADYYGGMNSQADMLREMPDNIKDLVLGFAEVAGGIADPVSWVNEENNLRWAEDLASRLAEAWSANSYGADGLDSFHRAEFIQAFVCSAIAYEYTAYPELPAQTLMEDGDCKGKSILLAALLKSLGYQVALLHFPPSIQQQEGHLALGIVFEDGQIPQDRELTYYPDNGQKYYFAETTKSGWTIGSASRDQSASIYKVD